MSEHNHHNHHDANDGIDFINKRTGRNMPAAIITAIILIALVLVMASIGSSVFVYLIAIVSVIALWELCVDFAMIKIFVPFVVLSFCSVGTILLTYYETHHFFALGASLALSIILISLAAAFNPFTAKHVHRAVQTKIAHQNGFKGKDHSNDVPPLSGRLLDICTSIFSYIYVPILGSFLVILLTESNFEIKILMALFLPACGDIGGLLFGVVFGKHKLVPHISPGKTYEGLLGSFILCIIGAYVFYYYGFHGVSVMENWWKPLVIGTATALSGTFGDLCASVLKRDIGIKDMGHLLRGHGGVLDRLDSILVCAPVMFILFKFLNV